MTHELTSPFFDSSDDEEEEEEDEASGLRIPSDLESVDGVIAQSLLMGDLETAVDLCLADDRFADALALASAGSPELIQRTRQRYFEERRKKSQVGSRGRSFLVIDIHGHKRNFLIVRIVTIISVFLNYD